MEMIYTSYSNIGSILEFCLTSEIKLFEKQEKAPPVKILLKLYYPVLHERIVGISSIL